MRGGEMGYLSFDCSCKIHASGRFTSTKTDMTGSGGIAGFFRHVSRNLDKKNGCEVNHTNENIDPNRTSQNEDYYKDSNGEWQRAESSKDMENAVKKRVQYAREHGARISSKGKNDTVIARSLILAISKDSLVEHENDWKKDMVEITEKLFGSENIVSWCCHMDEENPHLHVLFVPCHETETDGKKKCSINQTKFFKSPRQLASLHRQIRKELLKRNYQIELENKDIDEVLAGYYDKSGKFHQQGLTPTQLQKISDKKMKLRMEMIKMRFKEEDLEILEKNILEMKEREKARQEEFAKEREDFRLQQTSFDNDKAALQMKEYTLGLREMEVQRLEEDAEKTKKEAEKVIEICNQIISEKKHAYVEFMKFLDKEGRRLNKPLQKNIKFWCDKFRDKYFDENSREGMQIRRERLKDRDSRITYNNSDIPKTDYSIPF